MRRPVKLRISETFAPGWEHIELVDLRNRQVILTGGVRMPISAKCLAVVRTEMEARTGRGVLRVGALSFVPAHSVAHVFPEERVVALRSRGDVEIEPGFVGAARAFCDAMAEECARETPPGI